MQQSWWNPLDGTDNRRVVTFAIAAPGMILALIGLGEAVWMSSGFALLPDKEHPDANVVSGVLLPLLLFGAARAVYVAKPRTMGIIVVFVVVLANVANFATSYTSRDAGIGTTALFLLPAVMVSYLWSFRVAIAFSVFTAAMAAATFHVIETPTIALTHTTMFGVVVCGVSIGLVFARRAGLRDTATLHREHSVDQLTGLLTRQHTDEVVARLSAQPEFSGCALVLFDTDHFKSVNDTHGHQVGDMLLRHVAAHMRSVSGEGALCFRLGGDELGIYLPGTTLKEAQSLGRDIRRELSCTHLLTPSGERIGISVSWGAAYAANVAEVAALYVAADQALYAAKREARRVSPGAIHPFLRFYVTDLEGPNSPAVDAQEVDAW